MTARTARRGTEQPDFLDLLGMPKPEPVEAEVTETIGQRLGKRAEKLRRGLLDCRARLDAAAREARNARRRKVA